MHLICFVLCLILKYRLEVCYPLWKKTRTTINGRLSDDFQTVVTRSTQSCLLNRRKRLLSQNRYLILLWSDLTFLFFSHRNSKRFLFMIFKKRKTTTKSHFSTWMKMYHEKPIYKISRFNSIQSRVSVCGTHTPTHIGVVFK